MPQNKSLLIPVRMCLQTLHIMFFFNSFFELFRSMKYPQQQT
jgi:hypothetical protein